MGIINAHGVYEYDETDREALASALLNKQAAALSKSHRRVAAGAATVSAAAGGTKLTDHPVVFPEGRFTEPPIVMVQYTGGPGNAQYLVVRPVTVSTGGFIVQVYNTHATTTLSSPVNWIAVQA